MVVDGSRQKIPLHRQFTPYLSLFALICGHKYNFFIPVFCIVLCVVAYIYGFRNHTPWPSEKPELSAYSVFNPNQEELLGTLSAARIDREMRGISQNQVQHMKTQQQQQQKREQQEAGSSSRSWGKGNKLS
mgnify:CR=1 FL=1